MCASSEPPAAIGDAAIERAGCKSLQLSRSPPANDLARGVKIEVARLQFVCKIFVTEHDMVHARREVFDRTGC